MHPKALLLLALKSRLKLLLMHVVVQVFVQERVLTQLFVQERVLTQLQH